MSSTSGLRVLVTVGTDHHPFERLVRWVEELVDEGILEGSHVVCQHGASRPPARVVVHDRLPRHELVASMAASDVVIAQGGPGTILDARRAGRVPVVVPRLARRGEVVDDHQVAFAEHLADEGLIHLAEDRAALERLLRRAARCPEQFALAEAEAAPDTEAIGRRLEEVVAHLPAGRPPLVRRLRELVQAARITR